MRNFTLLLLFFILPFTNSAQVTIVDESVSNDSEIVFSPSAANNRILIVGVSSLSLLDDAVSAIDYGGNRLNEIDEVSVSSTILSVLLYQNAGLYYLDEADITSRAHDTINITFDNDGLNISEKYVSIFLLENVDQNTPVSYALSNSSDNAKIIDTGIPMPVNTDDMIISISGHSSILGSYSSTGGGTEIHEINGLASSHSASYRSINSYDRYTPEFTKTGIGVPTTNMVISSVRINANYYESPGGVADEIELWLKADAGSLNGSSVASDGETLDRWLDKAIVRQNDPSSSQLSPPIFYDNSSNNINFNPIIDFDGETMGFDLGDDYIYSSNNGITIFALVKPDSVSSSKSRQYITDFGFAGNEGYGFTYGYDNIFGYTSTAHGGSTFETNHTYGTTSVILRYDIDFSSEFSAYINNEFSTSSNFTLSQLTTNEVRESSNHGTERGPFTIGSQSKSGALSSNQYRLFDGKIGEIIVYSEDLSSTHIQQIESYLAIKYGITLGSTSSTYDYLNSSGSTIWSGDAIYQNDIAGIGRDDHSGLYQKQSKSNNSDDILTIGLGSIETTNSSNANSFSTDISYLMWGNNNEGNFSYGFEDIGTTNNGEEIITRLGRIWLAQETGTIDSVNIQFNTSEIIGSDGTAGSNELSALRLLVDADGSFETGATSVNSSSYDDTTDLINFNHDFEAGTGFYFTLGSVDFALAPLPVDLINFQLKISNNKPLLSWSTATETNNKHFEILRSIDGKNWINIDTVTGAGNSIKTLNYSYTDLNLKTTSSTIYYMLKQVDFDGKSKNSQVKSLELGEHSHQVIVYPNPSKQNINIDLAHIEKSIFEINFINSIGLNVYNLVTSQRNNIINIENLPTGLYSVVIKDHTTASLIKTVKLIIE